MEPDFGGMEPGAAAAGGVGVVGLLIQLAVALFMIIVGWKILVKAGKPGWGILIPIWNMILMLQAAGKSPWLFLLILIPGVGSLILLIILGLGLAEKFGKGGGFAVGLILLPPIFMAILAFGSAQYEGGAAPAAPAETPAA